MTRYIQGKDGKFGGSIGDGKTKVPTVADTPVLNQPSDDAPPVNAAVADLYEKYQSAGSGSQYDAPSAYARAEQGLASAERATAEAQRNLSDVLSWAYPGTGDLDGERELAEAYGRLEHAQESLAAARVAYASTVSGRAKMTAQIASLLEEANQRDAIGHHDGAQVSRAKAADLTAAVEQADQRP